jgi:hydroxymethylglutaryl-CoA lyase
VREVSPRDGLQGEPEPIATEDKIRLVDMLSAAGFKRINVTSFVSPRVVPQMADAAEVMAGITREPDVVYDATVPNLIGAQRAIEAGADAIVVFVAASEAGSRSNVKRSTEESMAAAEEAIRLARDADRQAVATVSTAFGSPYGEFIAADRVSELALRFAAAGATAIALGDTSGEANPDQVHALVARLRDELGDLELALHFHDTRGLALANALAAMDAGATHFDGAVGGIGGSPFTRNSAGNLATEDFLFMCHAMGIETGIDLDAVLDAHDFLESLLGRRLPGKVGALDRGVAS